MEPIQAEEGWFVLHEYYRVDRRLWGQQTAEERDRSCEALTRLIDTFRRMTHCQAYTYAVWGHKADFGVMLVDTDLDHLNQVENDLLSAVPAGVLEPVYSFTSMTEVSEYITPDADYKKTLTKKEGLVPDSPEFQQKLKSFRERIQVYVEQRLHPRLPQHRVMCFYPMNKARRDQNNWYLLGFDERKQMMGGHLVTGRKFAGKVKQLVTGSFGLDAWEWGVTLFADDPYYLKKILYDMRFDRVSAVYGEFGDFLVGINLEPKSLLERLRL